MKLIESKTLATAAAFIEFTSIPQDATDLVVLCNIRLTADNVVATLSFNTGGTYTRRRLQGGGAGVLSDTASVDLIVNPSPSTSNTFSNNAIYIPNYTGATAKSYSSDSVTENNATEAFQTLIAGLWSGTDAITSLKITGGNNLASGSTISLYKITKGSDGIVTTS